MVKPIALTSQFARQPQPRAEVPPGFGSIPKPSAGVPQAIRQIDFHRWVICLRSWLWLWVVLHCRSIGCIWLIACDTRPAAGVIATAPTVVALLAQLALVMIVRTGLPAAGVRPNAVAPLQAAQNGC